MVTAGGPARDLVSGMSATHEHSGLLGMIAAEAALEQATCLAWLACTDLGLGDEPAQVFLRDGRLALGRGLNYGPQGAGRVRLNFATSPEHLSDAVARMATARRYLSKTRPATLSFESPRPYRRVNR